MGADTYLVVTGEKLMAADKPKIMDEKGKAQSTSEERKIYPLTGEIIERGDQIMLDHLRRRKQKREEGAREIPRL